MKINWDEKWVHLHKFSLFAICLPKIIKIGGNLTKFWQKEICTVFFWDTVYIGLVAAAKMIMLNPLRL